MGVGRDGMGMECRDGGRDGGGDGGRWVIYVGLTIAYIMPSSPGLDYVSHEEVLPYTSTDSDEPFRHELFEQFLVPSTDDSSECSQI